MPLSRRKTLLKYSWPKYETFKEKFLNQNQSSKDNAAVETKRAPFSIQTPFKRLKLFNLTPLRHTFKPKRKRTQKINEGHNLPFEIKRLRDKNDSPYYTVSFSNQKPPSHPKASSSFHDKLTHLKQNFSNQFLKDRELEEYNSYRHEPLLQSFEAQNFYKNKRELCFSGGGGAGGALVDALMAAIECGLDLNRVERVNATSVGVFIAMAIVLEIPTNELQALLEDMPRDSFQDWDWWESINNFPSTWAWCKGSAMTNYFRDVIEFRTGLKDPTFGELYEAGYTKELCINTTNLSTGSIGIFSFKRTPNKKVAEIMTLACTVPGVFPPKWVIDQNGTLGLHADGGILNNFPFGTDSPSTIHDDERLGFVFVNEAVGYSMDGQRKAQINTFLDYMKQVFWVFVSKNPLSLPDRIKENVIAILLNHPPLIFNPSEEQQTHLSRAGRLAVYKDVLNKLGYKRPSKELRTSKSKINEKNNRTQFNFSADSLPKPRNRFFK